jgi:hypothetical protein
MRLSEAKIRYLSERLARWLESRADVELLAGSDVVALDLAAVFRDELRLEDELEEEVERVIRDHRAKISGNMDLGLLRQKIKKQLAKERGIVL